MTLVNDAAGGVNAGGVTTGRITRFLGGALICAALGVASVGPALADPVTVRSEQQAGLGRIVFSWPAPVAFQAGLAGDTLTVVFERPVAGDLTGLARQFPA